MLAGAAAAYEDFLDGDVRANGCLRYAALRNILYRKGKSIEILAVNDPALTMTCEWWKQLFGESEGKDGKGLYPSSAVYSTDLHSIGQFIQEGNENHVRDGCQCGMQKTASPFPLMRKTPTG